MKHLIIVSVLCLFTGNAVAKDMIFYKYADGDSYSVFVSSSDEEVSNLSARDVIARKMVGASFCLENVPKEYYTVKSESNIAFFGEAITQYEIAPRTADRFSHIVWVDKDGKLIKTEIYDLNKRLLFAFSSVDFSADKKIDHNQHNKNTIKPGKPFFKGFSHAFTKYLAEDVTQLVFMDGLNKFSVFIDKNPKDSGTVSKVVYGNYLLSKVLKGIEYTIIGSIPYSTMEEFISVLSDYKSEIKDVIKTGALITDDIYTNKIYTEEILK